MPGRFGVLESRHSLHAQSLSGGEQQILAVAPLLIQPPALLIADEPTLGLAPLICEEIIGYLLEIKERGSTIIVADEKPRSSLATADQVVLMQRGQIAWIGTPTELETTVLDDVYHLSGSAAP